MAKLKLRKQQIRDARRLLDILQHEDFVYFPTGIRSLKEEQAFLRRKQQEMRDGRCLNCSILYRNRVIGVVGFTFHDGRSYSGEIGYFIDRAYWNRGFATEAVRLLEEELFAKHGVHRIELLTLKPNRASQRVAVKAGYRREGLARGAVLFDGQYRDAYRYAKLNPDA